MGKFILAISLVVLFLFQQAVAQVSSEAGGNSREDRRGLRVIDSVPKKETLREIIVKGKQSSVAFKIDRQVFKASAYAGAQQGSAVDLLRNLPTVTVNGQGEIAVRGSASFQVMVNGRPTQGDPAFVLAQIPAAQIESVEIIGIPGAAFDADGRSGVINIITKNAPEQGLLLQANLMVGAPSLQGFGNTRYADPSRGAADLAVSWRKGPWEIGGGVNYLRNDMTGYREGEVMTMFQGRRTDFPSEGERSFRRYNQGGRLSISYESGTRHRYEAALYRGKRYQSRVADLFYDNRRTILSTGTTSTFRYYNENTQDKEGMFTLASLSGTHRIGESATWSWNGQYEGADLTSQTTNQNLATKGSLTAFQTTSNPGSNPLQAGRLRTDYTVKKGIHQWQTGYQFRLDRQQGRFSYQYQNLGSPGFTTDPDFSGEIEVRNRIHAGYLQYGAEKGKFAWQAGLRVEKTHRTLDITTSGPEQALDLLNAFPSGLLRYNIRQGSVVKAGYSRRIKRTNNFELNPIPEREHSETLEQGDPALLPELIGSWELGWENRIPGGGSFSASLYHQRIKNPIQRVNSVFNDTILNRVYTNAAKALQTGVEANLTLRAGQRWQGILGANIYRYDISGNLFGQPTARSNGSWVFSINTTQTLTFDKGWMTQFSLSYLSVRATVQGRDGAFVVPNLLVKKSFTGNRWSLTAQWLYMDAGLGISNRQRITTSGTNFYTTTHYIYEPDQLQLSATYLLSRKNRKINLPQSEMAEKEF